MITYNIFEIKEGFGYKILLNDNPIIVQEYDPDEPGFVLMSREMAEIKAKMILERIEV